MDLRTPTTPPPTTAAAGVHLRVLALAAAAGAGVGGSSCFGCTRFARFAAVLPLGGLNGGDAVDS